MNVWQFILFFISWFLFERLCIHWEVKSNPDLFYSLHQKEIENEIKKLEKKGEIKK